MPIFTAPISRNFAATLEMVSPGAGETFLHHHTDATVLMGNYRARIRGLARELEPSYRHEPIPARFSFARRRDDREAT